MNKFLRNIIILITSFILLSAILIISILWTYSNDLPDYKFLKNYKPPVSSKVYSGNGDLVADFSKEKRVFVPFNSIPKNVINAFLSAEDKNFFKHPGVDAKGVIRAVINNISNILSSKRLEGASTITQQVAKNFLLTNEVSLNRKIKEAILAFRIERALSKERILELYLNQIYLGSGAYGVAAASLEYFDKSIKDLNYSEAALLAALPKAPSRYNPYRDPDIAKFRRNLVLKNLLDNNYLTSEWYEKLTKKGEKLNFQNYFVEKKAKPRLKNVVYEGSRKAMVSKKVLDIINQSDTLIIGPSNPILSIGPILSLSAINQAIQDHNNVIAISPFVGKKALKGPSVQNFNDMGYTPDIQGLKKYYKNRVNKFFVNHGDSDGSSNVFEEQIVFKNETDSKNLANRILQNE